MSVLTKSQIQTKTTDAARKMERVELPEWDGYLYVREMSAAERDAFDEMAFGIDPKKEEMIRKGNYRAKYLVMCCCDGNGSLVFAQGDAEWLGSMPALIVQRLFEVAQRVNGMTLENAAKNSNSDQDDVSSSA